MEFSYNDAVGSIPDYIKSRKWYNEDFKKYLNKLSLNTRNLVTHLAKKYYFQNTGILRSRHIGLKDPKVTNEHWNNEIIEWVDNKLYEHGSGLTAGERLSKEELLLIRPQDTDRSDIYKIFKLTLRVSFDIFSDWINNDLSSNNRGYPKINLSNKPELYKVYNQFILFIAELFIKNKTTEINSEILDKFISIMKNKPKDIGEFKLSTKFTMLFSNQEIAKIYETAIENIKNHNFSSNDLIIVDRVRSWYYSYINGKDKPNPWYNDIKN